MASHRRTRDAFPSPDVTPSDAPTRLPRRGVWAFVALVVLLLVAIVVPRLGTSSPAVAPVALGDASSGAVNRFPVRMIPVPCTTGLTVAAARAHVREQVGDSPAFIAPGAGDDWIVDSTDPPCAGMIAERAVAITATAHPPVPLPSVSAPTSDTSVSGGVSVGGGRDRDHVRVCVGHIVRVCS